MLFHVLPLQISDLSSNENADFCKKNVNFAEHQQWCVAHYSFWRGLPYILGTFQSKYSSAPTFSFMILQINYEDYIEK